MTITERRLSLHAAGFEPVPVIGKETFLPNWNRAHSREEVASWEKRFPQWPGTGGRTQRMPTLDLDILSQDAAAAAEELVRERYEDRGAVLVRFGLPPKRAIPFRTARPFTKMRVELRAPNGQSHKIEFLADGQQVVLDGVHPETGRPYSWHAGRKPGAIALADLPEINEDEARKLLDDLAAMLQAQFGFVQAQSNGHAAGTSEFIARADAERGPVDVGAELAAMSAGKSANAVQIRIVPNLLRKAEHPDDILKFIADETMERVGKRLGWSRDVEVRAVRRRILSAYNNLLLEDYDPTTGAIPAWLPGEFHADWIARLKAGRRPIMGFNRHGFYVRSYGPEDAAGAADASKDAGEDAKEAESPASPKVDAGKTAEQKKYRFPLIAFDELRPGTEQSYLVDELFPTAGLALVYGAPKSGKSFSVFDVMMHVALGWEYRDRAVQQGPVIYCAFEGAHGYHKRGEAFRRHHCLTDERPPMFVVPGRADLIKDHAALIADMRGQLTDRGVSAPPKAVVLDTLNKSLIGSESKDVDMANYIAAAEAIQKAFGCLVIIVHHHGIEESRPRGHTSLRGAIDVMIRIDRDDRNNILATVEEMRDGPEGAQIASRLVKVTVGEDLKGKPLTSAAVESVDVPPEARQRGPKLTPNQRTMLALLEEAGPGGLTVDEWNERARAAGLAKHRRAELVDLRSDLKKKGLVVDRNGVWLIIHDRGPDL